MAATRKPGKREQLEQVAERQGEAIARYNEPTKEAERREAPTNADNVSEAPTNADNTELVRISGRIVKWQRDKLERIAARDGRLFSDVLREAVREYLRGH
jgi:hypothetical protein